MSILVFQESLRQCPTGQIGGISQPQPAMKMLSVLLDGLDADLQILGNLSIVESSRDECGYLPLARGGMLRFGRGYQRTNKFLNWVFHFKKSWGEGSDLAPVGVS